MKNLINTWYINPETYEVEKLEGKRSPCRLWVEFNGRVFWIMGDAPKYVQKALYTWMMRNTSFIFRFD